MSVSGPATGETIGLYSDAKAYDILHTPGTAFEVSELERLAGRWVTGQAARSTPGWLEPACGTGRYLRVAAGRGIRCVGFDLDPGMVAYANATFDRRGLDAAAFVGDMERFEPGVGRERFTFAFNTINTVRHLASDAAVRRHLADVAGVLRPGGVYAIGLSLASYGLEFPSEDVWEGTRGSCRVSQTIQYMPGSEGDRWERVYSHVVVETPSGERHEPSSYALRTYDFEQWLRVVRGSAMEIAASVTPDGVEREPSAPGYSVFVLRPRA
ncbi:MAG: class I SAM-dependent methyltransferase [Planctomycetota bacterium]